MSGPERNLPSETHAKVIEKIESIYESPEDYSPEQPRSVLLSPQLKLTPKSEREAQISFLRTISGVSPELLEGLDERTKVVLDSFSTVTDKPVILNDVAKKLDVNKTTVRTSLLDGVATLWEAAPEEIRMRFPWETLYHHPIEEAKKQPRQEIVRDYKIEDFDLELWQTAQEEHLLEKIEADKLMDPEKIKRLKDYFEGRRAGKDIESILDEFSKRLANVA